MARHTEHYAVSLPLGTFFSEWVDLVVWPKLSDWWARRSITAIKREIRILQSKVDYRP
jgi:hypothetical protein